MQHNFQQQKQTLLVSYGKPSMEQLSPAMKKELKQLGDARASIRKALASDENNADLLNLLDFTQQQELKLLQQLYRQYQVI
jgi:3-dehydroquinate dehydratase